MYLIKIVDFLSIYGYSLKNNHNEWWLMQNANFSKKCFADSQNKQNKHNNKFLTLKDQRKT